MHHDRLVAWLLRKCGELPTADPGLDNLPHSLTQILSVGSEGHCLEQSLAPVCHRDYHCQTIKACCQKYERTNNYFKIELHSTSKMAPCGQIYTLQVRCSLLFFAPYLLIWSDWCSPVTLAEWTISSSCVLALTLCSEWHSLSLKIILGYYP